METMTATKKNITKDFLPINGTDYIEFYVGNSRQAAHYYQSAFGFQPLAYAGPETGVRDRASYVLRQNKIRFVLTSPLQPEGNISAHILKHGDGVKVLALWVDDAEKAFDETVKRGAKPYLKPQSEKDDFGEVKRSGICLYGDTVHIFVERKNYDGIFLPGYKTWTPHFKTKNTGLLHVDHCVANVGWNEMNQWVNFYEEVMGFRNLISFDDKTITTEYSALMSKVMSNGNGRIKFPINEPAEGKKKSQIEEYLDYYRSQGIQHVAMATNNIIETVTNLQDRGVEFLKVPATYYDHVLERVGKIEEDLAPLRKLGILIDRDDEGYLLQIFTKPVQVRPTLFFEIIERKGAQSFGAGNFKALFEAIEREQALRGNL
ncbi:MAG: 4-hydroxyphenylpyruvate dioxygenase [Chitinophagaceae bacterium]|nr:MAG: 4-hydroxyphenylpyruvate dioxygenase [Chitinophagaceae bacterium]